MSFLTPDAVPSSPLMASSLLYMAKSRSQAFIAQASELVQETTTNIANSPLTKTSNIDGSWMDRAHQQLTTVSSSVFGQSKEEPQAVTPSQIKPVYTYENQDEEEKENLSAKLLSRLNQGAETAADNWRAVETKLKEGAETAVEDLRTATEKMDLGKLWGDTQPGSKEGGIWPIDSGSQDDGTHANPSEKNDGTRANPSEALGTKFLSVVESVKEGLRTSETILRQTQEGVFDSLRASGVVFDRQPQEGDDGKEEEEDGEDLPPEKFLSTPSSYLLINDIVDGKEDKKKGPSPKKAKKKKSSKSKSKNGEQMTPVAMWNVHEHDKTPVLKKFLSLFESEETTFDREPLYEKDTHGGSNQKAVPFENLGGCYLDCTPLEALAVEPMEITFPVPEDHVDGNEIAFQGPHGPMSMMLGDGLVPGEIVRVRLAPAPDMNVEVPPGSRPGQVVEFEGPDGKQRRTIVPSGKRPGDMFEVCPPSMCIRVPEGAKAGDYVQFKTSNGHVMAIQVPEGVPVDQYFSALI